MVSTGLFQKLLGLQLRQLRCYLSLHYTSDEVHHMRSDHSYIIVRLVVSPLRRMEESLQGITSSESPVFFFRGCAETVLSIRSEEHLFTHTMYMN